MAVAVARGCILILSYAVITASRATAGEPATLALLCSHDLVLLTARVDPLAMTLLSSDYAPASDYVRVRREGKMPQPPADLPAVVGCPDKSAPL